MPCQTLVLPPLCPQYPGICHEQVCISCNLWFLHTFSKWFAFPHLEHLLPYAGHLHNLCLFPQYLQFMSVFLRLDFVLSGVLFFCSCVFTASNALLSFVASVSAFCALCALTLLIQANTCSLVISLVFLCVVNS